MLPVDCTSIPDGQEDPDSLASANQHTAVTSHSYLEAEISESHPFTAVESELAISKEQNIKSTESFSQHTLGDENSEHQDSRNAALGDGSFEHTNIRLAESLSGHRLTDTQTDNNTSELLSQYQLDSLELGNIQLAESTNQSSRHSLPVDCKANCSFSQYTLEDTLITPQKSCSRDTQARLNEQSLFGEHLTEHCISEAHITGDDNTEQNITDKHDSYSLAL